MSKVDCAKLHPGQSLITCTICCFYSPVLASCQSPGGIAHGKKFGSDYSHNKTVRYECDVEYTLEGKNRLTCNDGKWNYNPPQCKGKKVNNNICGYWPSSRSGLQDIDPVFFLYIYDRDGVEVLNHAKKEHGHYLAILTEQTWPVKDLLCGKRTLFSCGSTEGNPKLARYCHLARSGSQL